MSILTTTLRELGRFVLYNVYAGLFWLLILMPIGLALTLIDVLWGLP